MMTLRSKLEQTFPHLHSECIEKMIVAVEEYYQTPLDMGGESGKPEPVEQGKQWLLRWLIEERNLLSNSASLMWNDPLQEKTKRVAECLRVTIEYIEKSFEEATKKQHG